MISLSLSLSPTIYGEISGLRHDLLKTREYTHTICSCHRECAIHQRCHSLRARFIRRPPPLQLQSYHSLRARLHCRLLPLLRLEISGCLRARLHCRLPLPRLGIRTCLRGQLKCRSPFHPHHPYPKYPATALQSRNVYVFGPLNWKHVDRSCVKSHSIIEGSELNTDACVDSCLRM